MAESDSDRRLLVRLVAKDPLAWNEFVDRYVGLLHHTVRHSCHMRSVLLAPEEIDDLVADVLTEIVDDNLRILRQFRGKSRLSTYLGVVARRIAVQRLARRQAIERRREARDVDKLAAEPDGARIDDEDEVHRLLGMLHGREAELVRNYYLNNKTYHEISLDMGIPENSIGPILTRLRDRLRKAAQQAG